MTILNVSLPDAMREFIDAQVAEAGYTTASEYIHALVQEAQKQKAKKNFEDWLLEGLNGAEAAELTAEEWEERKRQFRERRLAELRQEVAVGLQELDRGEGIPAEEVFQKLRQHNRQSLG
jgi:antitoxin ParD1/3/4